MIFARWTRPSARTATKSCGTNTVSMLVAATLIVAGVAGFKAWTYWQERNSQEAGTEFSQALGALDGGDAAKANNALNDFGEGTGRLSRASPLPDRRRRREAGNTDKAVTLYDALAADSGTDNILKGLATIQAATLKLDTADYAEMEGRLKGLIEQGSPGDIRRGALGLSAYRSNKILMPKSNSARSSPIRERPRTCVSAPT